MKTDVLPAGVDVCRKNGDAVATLIPVPECGNPDKRCELVVGPYGKTECVYCEIEQNLNGRMTTLSLTKLAERLAGK